MIMCETLYIVFIPNKMGDFLKLLNTESGARIFIMGIGYYEDNKRIAKHSICNMGIMWQLFVFFLLFVV